LLFIEDQTGNTEGPSYDFKLFIYIYNKLEMVFFQDFVDKLQVAKKVTKQTWDLSDKNGTMF